MADLEEQLKEKIDSHSQLSLKKEQLDRDLEGQQTVLQGQTELIGHLEEELDARAKSEKQLQQVGGSGDRMGWLFRKSVTKTNDYT